MNTPIRIQVTPQVPRRPTQRTKPRFPQWLVFFVVGFVCVLMLNLKEFLPFEISPTLLGILPWLTAFVCILAFSILSVFQKGRRPPAPLSSQTYEFSDAGLTIHADSSTSLIPWQRIRRVERDPSRIVFQTDDNVGIVIPRRFISDPAQADALEMLLREKSLTFQSPAGDPAAECLIRIPVQLSFQHYRTFGFRSLFRVYRWLLVIALFGIVAFLLTPCIATPDATGQKPSTWQVYRDNLSILILPGIVALIPVLTYVGIKKRWDASPALGEPWTYEFSDAGLSIRGVTFHEFTTWDHIERAGTVGSLIAIYNAQNLAYLIPIAAFPDPAQLEEFYVLLRANVPDCTRLPPPPHHAFPAIVHPAPPVQR